MDLSDLPIVDGHCHPLLADPWTVSPEQLLDLLSEGRPGSMRAHVPHTGYFRRVVGELARRLGVDAAVEAVLEARRTAGTAVARAMITEARIKALLVDTGYPPTAMPLDTMRAALPCAIHEVFRIERCAEQPSRRACRTRRSSARSRTSSRRRARAASPSRRSSRIVPGSQ